jgi:hypothetical protein
MCDGSPRGVEKEPIDAYLHTYYEGIEQLYREHIYRLGI